MDLYLLEQLNKKIDIASLNIIRENMEMQILDLFSKEVISKKFIFYGGTALRLAYGSPRFSEDLDFLMIKKISEKELKKILEKVIKNQSGLSLKDIKDKRYTLFALLNLKHLNLKHALNIKIEISKKKNGINYEYLPLHSECSNLTPIIPVAKINSIEKLKIQAIKQRIQSRDWFDLWFISKYLKKSFEQPKKIPFPKKEFKREMKRFLTRNNWVLIDQLINQIHEK
ncbi:hypothetical protein CL633_03890 [bacterium]|nr:hypothetical protein [bacterium]|tara:strand:- start:1631 stop:2311 length:681 start_codon:yes stop_codon:yes gene_type:complete